MKWIELWAKINVSIELTSIGLALLAIILFAGFNIIDIIMDMKNDKKTK